MTGTFIATTREMRPLACQGIPVSGRFTQITDLVRALLGEEQALLFAEPVFDEDRESVDWYSPVQGCPCPIGDLPEAEQKAARSAFVRLGGDIRAAALTLQNSGDSRKLLRGRLLELALSYPDATCLYVVNGQPVLIGWGFGPSSAGAQPQDISRSAGPAVLSRTPEDVGAVRRGAGQPLFGRLIWLLPLLLLLGLAALLFVSWGGRPPLLPGFSLQGPELPFSAASSDDALKAARVRGAELDQLLEDLRQDLKRRAALCVRTPETPSPEQPEGLRIPKAALAASDLSFMQGVWRCDTGLKNTTTGMPVAVEYTFDASGNGFVSITGDKGECRGEATALLDAEGRLVIETREQIGCAKGDPYAGQRVICTQESGRAECRGRNLSDRGQTWDARFYRK